jgi:glucose/arabinose dehydrogenase/mono/diheme cytochrome c family protein
VSCRASTPRGLQGPVAALLAVSVLSAAALALTRRGRADVPPVDWRTEWAVDGGFALRTDTEGYEYPSAIAFVPNPGSRPKDPLYFVTELRGTLKVVTNDRTVYTFADSVFTSRPARELPDIEGETGMAGICLAPKQGYVFVTFAYRDPEGVLRNNIMRFQSAPGIFGTRATSRLAFTEIFSSYEAAVSHQIGPCQVDDDLLYVNVADGRKTAQAQQINSLLGKVLRMTLDGRPAPGNPFRRNDDIKLASNYVWAYGFRNPFGLRIVDGRVFVAENGSGIDRFVEARAGENYLWNGSDWSIGTNAAAVLPVVGPVQVDYNPGGRAGLPPRYAGNYFIALSAPRSSGVLTLPYSLEQRKVLRAPSQFIKYVGQGMQVVVGVGVGPDGVYFVPLMPDRTGRSAVLKVVYDPARAHPVLVERDPEVLIAEHGCAGCHRIKGAGGTAAPPLDRPDLVQSLRERLESEAYREHVAAVDRLDQEPYRSYRKARAEVLQANGLDQVRVWMKYRLVEPRFDDPRAQMPNLGLSEGEARTITAYLMGDEVDGAGTGPVERVKAAVAAALPAPAGPRELVLFFGAGLILGAVGLAALAWLWRAWSSR